MTARRSQSGKGILPWGLCPHTPGIYRFFFRQNGASLRCVLGGGIGCRPVPFRHLSRSLGLLPSIALSRPPQVRLV